MKKTLILTTCMALLLVSAASAAGWKKTIQKKGIIVYKKDVKGSSLKKMKATVTVDAPMSEVLAVLLDYKKYRQWHPNLVGFKEFNKREKSSTIYFAYSLPFPVKNRDAVLLQRLTIQKNKQLIVLEMKSKKDKRVPEKDDFVRIPRLYAKWSFKPAKSGKGTAITFNGYADMGGWVPNWLVNWLAGKRTLQSVEKLRERVKQRKFHRGIEKKYAFTSGWN